LGFTLAAPLLGAFVNYMLLSSAFSTHRLGERFLSGSGFPLFVVPYIYGPPFASSGRLFPIWGNVGGYAGSLTILMALGGVAAKTPHRRLSILLLAWVLIAWAKTFGVQPVASAMNYVPLLMQTAFYRYSAPSWELALVILAGFGLDNLRPPGVLRPFWRFVVVEVFLAVAVALAWPHRAFWAWPQEQIPHLSRSL